MKIKTVRCVQINALVAPPDPDARPVWNEYATRSLPISRYGEFSRATGKMPGTTMPKVWVQVIAEDGTFGLGRCANGEPAAALIDYYIAPLIEGRDALAIELINDLIWRSHEGFQGGIATVAQSGVDIALWDLASKRAELTV